MCCAALDHINCTVGSNLLRRITSVNMPNYFKLKKLTLLHTPSFYIIFKETDAKGKVKGKGNAVPLQAWTRPEGSRRLRLPDFNAIGTRTW